MNTLTLELSERIIDAAIDKAREMDALPLTIAILDTGGHLKALRREDAASTLRPDIAIAKARGAIALGTSSRAIGDICQQRPAFYEALSSIAPGDLIPAAGGVLIKNHDQAIIGAVGITGDNSDVDELCAIAGIEAVELVAR